MEGRGEATGLVSTDVQMTVQAECDHPGNIAFGVAKSEPDRRDLGYHAWQAVPVCLVSPQGTQTPLFSTRALFHPKALFCV